MTIDVQPTDNPQALRFELPLTISQRDVLYEDANQAILSPVANKIFGFPWTDKVRVGINFVEITKQDWVDWSVLEEPLKGLLLEHFSGRQENIEENLQPEPQAQKKTGQLDSQEAKTIQNLIEQQINPALANHGGFVVLHSVEDQSAFIEMGGGCQGCAMSYQTLKDGIEVAIKEAVPMIQNVVDITDHQQGNNPFY